MGFGDKLKGLKDQAQQAVAENKDKIQGAVQIVGDVANTKTKGSTRQDHEGRGEGQRQRRQVRWIR